MKPLSSILSVVVVCFWSAVVPANGQVNVTQFHNHDSRDGLYVDSAFTLSAAANLARDLNFDGTIVGNVYAQPLYIEDGPGGRPAIIAVTESNNVYALDALDGSIIWQANVGEPLSAGVPCTIIDPLGITSTPIVDLASRALFLAAMITLDGGTTKKHIILSLNLDTGDINPGWPVDVEATASYNGINFTPESQLQRAALGIVGNTLYVGYASHSDCSLYHGWLVGVPIYNPASVTAWAAGTTAGTHGGSIWGVGGIASDGNNPFVTTGNTSGTNGNWDGGEAVIRFQPGPIFSGLPSDYWVPTNWLELDNFDVDLGASGPLLVDVPEATPSSLVVALGKDGKAYLLNRDNLGGITAPIASAQVASYGALHQAAAAYRTNQGTYVALRASHRTLSAFRITGTNPPTIATGWSLSRDGCGSPFVTSTDGNNNMLVWVVGTSGFSGTGGDQRLHGYDGDTGAVVYDGGGPDELMAGTHSYSTTGIAARGRIYVAADNKIYAFTVPGGNPPADFSRDGHPDYLLYNAGTRQTAVWYLNNNVYIGGAYAPTLPVGWRVIDVADFNGDSYPDYALFNSATRQTAIWYFSGVTFIYGAYGPTLPNDWELVAAADFNGGGNPDYVLYKASSGQTAIWYLNDNVFVGGAYGPTLPPGWGVRGVADFNGDSYPDYALFNSATRQTAIWYLSGVTLISGAYGPTLPSGWELVAAADFNGDGNPDYLLQKASSGQTAIWYLHNHVFVGGAYGPTLPAGWSLATDSHPDYALFNSATRQTAIWYLSGVTFIDAAMRESTIPTTFRIGGKEYERSLWR